MARHRSPIISILMLVLALCSVPSAGAGPPTDQLRGGVDRVVKILKDPEFAGDKQLVPRRAAISKVAGELFDFGEMAKRSLGQHWDERTPSQRAEFVRLFTELIERSYISKVDQQEAAGKIAYRDETVDGDYALVQTTILLPHGNTMPLGYRMHNTSGRWQVYDLSIEGISIVANYRAQFNKIIRTSSFEELVARLKSNQAAFSAPSASPAERKPVR